MHSIEAQRGDVDENETCMRDEEKQTTVELLLNL